MEIRQLEHFYYVCRAGSFTLAARQIYMTQQGLSKSISQLEAELGVQLFERTPNAIHLTGEGRMFLRHCEMILTSVESTTRLMQSQSVASTQKIYIGFAEGTLDFFPKTFFTDLMLEEPNAFFFDLKQLRREDCSERVADGRLTMAVLFGPSQTLSFQTSELCCCGLYVYVPEGCDGLGEAVHPSALKGRKLILQNDFRHCYEKLEQDCRALGFIPDVVMKTLDRLSLERSCDALHVPGISYYSEQMVCQHPHSERLRPLDMENYDYHLMLITQRERNFNPQEREVLSRIGALWN